VGGGGGVAKRTKEARQCETGSGGHGGAFTIPKVLLERIANQAFAAEMGEPYRRKGKGSKRAVNLFRGGEGATLYLGKKSPHFKRECGDN